MTSKNKLLGIFLIILALSMLVIFFIILDKLAEPKNIEKETITIGVSLPLSSNAAFLGEGLQNAILLAQDSLSDTYYDYKVIFEDDQLDTKRATNVANKLININDVDIIISLTGRMANVISPIAQENKKIHFAISSDLSVAKDNKYGFDHWTPPQENAQTFVQELKKRDFKKIGVFLVNDDGAQAIYDEVQNKMKGTGISIVDTQIFEKGTSDFRTLILKSKQKKPELYLLLSFSPELELIAKQMKESSLDIPLTSIESFELTKEKDLFEGAWYVSSAEPSENFIEQYEAKYNKAHTVGSANGYDIFNLIVYAAENFGKTNGSRKPTIDELVDALHSIKNFQGALGDLSVDADGIVVSKASVKIIENGKPKMLGS